jgi:Domain of unknown function (DUF4258)
MRQKQRCASMSPREATECIRRKAEQQPDLAFTDHFQERLVERGLIMGDVLYVLKYGYVYEKPQQSTRKGLYKCLMEAPTPNSNVRTVSVVVIPYPSCAVKLVTVMWKDEKGLAGW